MGALVVSALTLLFVLISVACSVIIIVHAFKQGGFVDGLLCLLVPFFILYYAFVKFHHPRRTLVIGLWLGSALANVACQAALVAMSAGSGPAHYY